MKIRAFNSKTVDLSSVFNDRDFVSLSEALLLDRSRIQNVFAKRTHLRILSNKLPKQIISPRSFILSFFFEHNRRWRMYPWTPPRLSWICSVHQLCRRSRMSMPSRIHRGWKRWLPSWVQRKSNGDTIDTAQYCKDSMDHYAKFNTVAHHRIWNVVPRNSEAKATESIKKDHKSVSVGLLCSGWHTLCCTRFWICEKHQLWCVFALH